MTRNRQCRVYRLFSFFLPLLVLAVFFAIKGITPFGDSTFLIHDMNAQYVDFYAYMRTVLSGKNNFLYSFSRGLGGDFPSFFTYYLISPFNLIPILFPDELVPLGISLEMLLFFGLTGLSCFVSLEYFARPVDRKKMLFLMFLSAAYSLSGWMLLNAENFQFIQEAAILPMAIMYCQKVRKGERLLPAVLWLAAAVILNFYIGYMICIFSFLWMIIPEERKPDKRLLLVFAFVFLLSLPVIFTVIRQMGTTIKSMDPQWFTQALNFSLPDFLKKFLPGQFDHFQYRDNGLPAVYCGLIPFVAAVLFFVLNKNAAIKRHRLILIVILIISMFYRPLTMIWQGFSEPHWWPYRFSFLLIYLIILCAAECPRAVPWYLLPLGFAGLVYNLNVTLTVKLEEAVPQHVYAETVLEKAALLKSIDDNGDFFRIEDLAPRTDNDAMHFAYSGITHFDSLANRKIFEFLRNMGFPQDRYTLRYGLGNTNFANSLLGVRYVLSEGAITQVEAISSAAYILKMNSASGVIEAGDPYLFQNKIASFLGSESPILKIAEPKSYDLLNLECDDNFCWKIDPEREAAFVFHIDLPESHHLYAHMENQSLIGELFVGAENEKKTALNAPDYFIPIRKNKVEGTVDLPIIVDSAITDFPDLTFYMEDTEKISALFSELSEGISVKKVSSSELKINLLQANEVRNLFLTVPYDKGWKAFAGNAELGVSEVLDAFLCVSIPPSVSELRLTYH